MFENVDQCEITLGPDGTITLPPTLLEKTRWRPGARLLVEQTDDGVLVTEIEVPGDVEEG